MKEAFWHSCTRLDRMWPVVAPTASDRKLRLAICAGHPFGLLRKLGLDSDPPEDNWEFRLIRSVEEFADTGTRTDEFQRLRAAYCAALVRFESEPGYGDRDGDHYESSRLYRLVFGTAEMPVDLRSDFLRNTWKPDDEPACGRFRDIFGSPFRPIAFDLEWRTSTAVAVARGIYDERAFDRMTILADALQDANCTNAEMLNHCRGGEQHVRGCWVLDLVLDKK